MTCTLRVCCVSAVCVHRRPFLPHLFSYALHLIGGDKELLGLDPVVKARVRGRADEVCAGHGEVLGVAASAPEAHLADAPTHGERKHRPAEASQLIPFPRVHTNMTRSTTIGQIYSQGHNCRKVTVKV